MSTRENVVKVVSVINHKGGVGKTTLTANLGAGLAARGRKVLLIDLDSQASLTVSFFTQAEWQADLAPNKTIKNWFEGLVDEGAESLASLVATPSRVSGYLSHATGCLDLIAAHRDLSELDTALAAQLLIDPQHYLTAHRRLREGLAEKEIADYDVALIDCAPNFGLIAKNAVAASDMLLIPTRPDYLSINGIDSLGRKVQAFTQEYNEQLAEAGDGGARSAGRPPRSCSRWSSCTTTSRSRRSARTSAGSRGSACRRSAPRCATRRRSTGRPRSTACRSSSPAPAER